MDIGYLTPIHKQSRSQKKATDQECARKRREEHGESNPASCCEVFVTLLQTHCIEIDWIGRENAEKQHKKKGECVWEKIKHKTRE